MSLSTLIFSISFGNSSNSTFIRLENLNSCILVYTRECFTSSDKETKSFPLRVMKRKYSPSIIVNCSIRSTSPIFAKELRIKKLLYKKWGLICDCNCFSSEDRKSTRLNSSHVKISYAGFCLKKKKKKK